MTSLMDLFPEVLEEVVLKLEAVEDVISLASSSASLARIVSQERIWRVILPKTELVGKDGRVLEDRVKRITSFLSSIADREAIFSLLHQTIYDRFSATDHGWKEDSITVSSPSSPQLHCVSGLGLELLVLASREVAWHHTVHMVRMWRIPPSLLLSLASLEREQVVELVVGNIACTTAEEGRALVTLLDKCKLWSILWLDLAGEAGGQKWEELVRAGARGRARYVDFEREVLRRGRREELRAVWELTEEAWLVEGERIWKSDGEEGWAKIDKMIQ